MQITRQNKNRDPPEWVQFKRVADKVSSYCDPCGKILMDAYKLIKQQRYSQIKSQYGYITGLCTSNNEYPEFNGEVFVDDCFVYFENTQDLITKQQAYRNIHKNTQLKLQCPMSKQITYNPNSIQPIQLTDDFQITLPKLNYNGKIDIKFNTIDSIKEPHRLSEFPALRSNSGNSDYQLASLEMKTFDLRDDKGDRILANDPHACATVKSNFSKIDSQTLKQMKVFQYDPIDQVFKQYGLPKINEEDQIIQYSAPLPTISYVQDGLKRLGQKIKKQAKKDFKSQLDQILSQVSIQPQKYNPDQRWYSYDLQKNSVTVPKQARESYSTYFPSELSKCFCEYDKSPYFQKFYEGNLFKKDITYKGKIYKRFYFTTEDYLKNRINGLNEQTKQKVELLLQKYNHKTKLEMQRMKHKMQKIIQLQNLLRQEKQILQQNKKEQQQQQQQYQQNITPLDKLDKKLMKKQLELRIKETKFDDSIQYAFLNSMQISQVDYNYWLKCYIFCAIDMRSLGPIYYSTRKAKESKNISQIKSIKAIKQLENKLKAVNQQKISLQSWKVKLNKEDIRFLYLNYQSECKRRNADIYNRLMTQRVSESKEINKKLIEVQKQIESQKRQVVESLQNLVAGQFKNYKQKLSPYVQQLITSLSVSNEQTNQAEFLAASEYGYLNPYTFELKVHQTRQENQDKIKRIIKESYSKNGLLQTSSQRQRKPQRGGGGDPTKESPMIKQLKNIANTVKSLGNRNCNIDSIIRQIQNVTQSSNSAIKNQLQSLRYQSSSNEENKFKNQQTISIIQKMIAKLQHQLEQDQKNKQNNKTASSDISDNQQDINSQKKKETPSQNKVQTINPNDQPEAKSPKLDQEKKKIIQAKEQQYKQVEEKNNERKKQINQTLTQLEQIQKKQKQLMKNIEQTAKAKLSAKQLTQFQKNKNECNKKFKQLRKSINQAKQKKNSIQLDQSDLNKRKLSLNSIKGGAQKMKLQQLKQKIMKLDKKQGKSESIKYLDEINQKALDAIKSGKDLQKTKQQLLNKIADNLKAQDQYEKLNQMKKKIESTVDRIIQQMKQMKDEVNRQIDKTTPSDGIKQQARTEAIKYFTKELIEEISKHEKQFIQDSSNVLANAINAMKKDDKINKKVKSLLGL